MNFYESGYVDPRPKKSGLLNAIDLLVNRGYRRFAVCVDSFSKVDSEEGGIIQELANRDESFIWIKTRAELVYEGAKIDFLRHGKDKDLMRLRGPNYDAAIVQGKCSADFDTLLSFCLRLGDYPIKIKLA
jgi:hypothetical protein